MDRSDTDNPGFHWAVGSSSDDDELMLIPDRPTTKTNENSDPEMVEAKVPVPTPPTSPLHYNDPPSQSPGTPCSTPVITNAIGPAVRSSVLPPEFLKLPTCAPVTHPPETDIRNTPIDLSNPLEIPEVRPRSRYRLPTYAYIMVECVWVVTLAVISWNIYGKM